MISPCSLRFWTLYFDIFKKKCFQARNLDKNKISGWLGTAHSAKYQKISLRIEKNMVKSSELLIEGSEIVCWTPKDLTCDLTFTDAQKLAYKHGTRAACFYLVDTSILGRGRAWWVSGGWRITARRNLFLCGCQAGVYFQVAGRPGNIWKLLSAHLATITANVSPFFFRFMNWQHLTL